MKKRKFIKNIFTIAILISLSFFNKSYAQNLDKLYEKIDLFSEVLEKIQDEYVDDVDKSEIMDSAINGALQSLDPYSAYMKPEVFKDSRTETSGEFGGLGIEVSMESGVVKVIAPIDNTPASKAGIKAGDYIVKIDGKQVQGKTLMEAVNLMRGPVDTAIKLTVRRKGLKKAKVYTIIRKVIEVKSVASKTVSDKVGYLRLRVFNENSSDQLKKAISKIEKNKKMVGYILDLRNNPGGLLSQAIIISDFFLNNGEIVSTRGRKKSENRKFFAKKGDKINGKPLIVLINNGSASASEIVAGALQDQKRAILLGQTTFGKGSVQAIIPLKNKGAIRLTTSKYYLPSGRSISEVGITPDIEIEEKDEEFSINTDTDNQLNYAINLFIG
jgi:carboxyl-terminal processing protease|tara:strand:- start:776 stop:1930 length:1155 start_codon:yes stop_codon:yes gene_type:complete